MAPFLLGASDAGVGENSSLSDWLPHFAENSSLCVAAAPAEVARKWNGVGFHRRSSHAVAPRAVYRSKPLGDLTAFRGSTRIQPLPSFLISRGNLFSNDIAVEGSHSLQLSRMAIPSVDSQTHRKTVQWRADPPLHPTLLPRSHHAPIHSCSSSLPGSEVSCGFISLLLPLYLSSPTH